MFGVRRVAGVAAICLLLVVTVGLVGAALIRHRHHTVAPVVTSTDDSSTSQKIAAAYVTAASAKPASLMSLSDTTHALLVRGGCSGKAVMIGTSNGGQTWTAVPTPAVHILRLQVVSSTKAWVIGADSTCHATYYSINVSGGGWVPAASIGSAWYSTRHGVHVPSGQLATPCAQPTPGPVSLAPSGRRNAIVVCAKGIYRTANAGRAWNQTGAVPDGHPVSAALNGQRAVMLLDGAPQCSGLRAVYSSDEGRTWRRGSCLGGLTPSAGVALTTTGGGLASDGRADTYVTTDNGASWRLATS